MRIDARVRWFGVITVVVVLAATGCKKEEPPASDSTAAPASTTTSTTSTTSTAPAVKDITVRAPDAFYDPPADVPNRPGALLRSEPLKDVTLPLGTRGWRILYTTTIDDDTPATAVATVFAPANMPAGPRPVIAWEHGTTGVLQKCMPSLVSAPSEGIPALDRVMAAGWVAVATDYSFAEKGGPHPYIIGEGEARAALDAVRAARQMPELTLDKRTVVWGHSQGGHAALWTGIIGPRYAPDVELVGVAAIAPTADMKSIVESNVLVNKRLGPYLALAYSRFYPDVKFEAALRPEAVAAARDMVNLCGFFPREDPQKIAALAKTFDGPALATTNAAFAARLTQNTADGTIAAPLLIAQGLADSVVSPRMTDAYVERRCAAGQRLQFWTFYGADHGTIVQDGTPLRQPLIAWTTARFANEPQPKGCTRTTY